MEHIIKISLIIPFYKKISFLKLIFQGLKRQSFKNFEVVIAEDDNALETKEFLNKMSQSVNFPIQHVYQEDLGFQKSKIMNKAIMKTHGNFIVFIDGDCIPHKHFLKEYYKNIEENFVLLGRRVMMNKKITELLIKQNSIKKITIFNLLLSGSKKVEDGLYLPFRKFNKNVKRGICGCNWGVSKKNLLDVNGYDEDYIYASVAEDSDIEWRLSKLGVKLKKMKNKAIVYHLYHNANYSQEQVTINEILLKKKLENAELFCSNGIKKI